MTAWKTILRKLKFLHLVISSYLSENIQYLSEKCNLCDSLDIFTYGMCVVHVYKDETFLVFLYKLNILQTCNREGQEYLLGILY